MMAHSLRLLVLNFCWTMVCTRSPLVYATKPSRRKIHMLVSIKSVMDNERFRYTEKDDTSCINQPTHN